MGIGRTVKNRCIGAPKGGRVHWLLWSLPAEFKREFTLKFDYSKHNYVFYRNKGNSLYDIFIVEQSSKHYWRMAYVNVEKQKYVFDGDNKTTRLARRMWYIYKIDKL